MKLEIKNQQITLTEREPLVSGTVNVYTAEFSFDSAWDGYTPVAVFESTVVRHKVSREVAITDGKCTVPWETLLPNSYLKIGVYGVSGDKRLPTIYADSQSVARGTAPADPAAEPTPGVVEQIVSQVSEDRAATEAAADRAEEAALRQPCPNAETGTWWVWDAESGAYRDSGEAYGGGGSGGTTDHSKLINRDAADQHPMSAISGLEKALEDKQPTGDYLTQEALVDAVDAALTAAKESGEFDGTSGEAATIEIVGTETLDAGQPAAVEEAEGSTAQERKYTLKVPQGPTGEAATVEITGIETLAPGELATLSEAEDSTPAHRKYVIGVPQGATGKGGLGVPVPTAEDAGKVPMVNEGGMGYGLGLPSGGEEWKSVTYDFSQEYVASDKLDLPAPIKKGYLIIRAIGTGLGSGTGTVRLYADVETTSGNPGSFIAALQGLYSDTRVATVYFERIGTNVCISRYVYFGSSSVYSNNAQQGVVADQTFPESFLYLGSATTGMTFSGTATLYYVEA